MLKVESASRAAFPECCIGHATKVAMRVGIIPTLQTRKLRLREVKNLP